MSWDPRLTSSKGGLNWPRNYAALLEYGKEHGHYNVPSRCVYECLLPSLAIG